MISSSQKYIRCLQEEAAALGDPDGLHIILYGSTIYGHRTNGDIDVCIVIEKEKIKLSEVQELISKCIPKADVRFYYLHELRNPLFFRDINNGTFAVEYLAGGTAVVGENPFIDLLSTISRPAYRQSLKHKMFDYILRIRRVFLNKKRGRSELSFVEKYTRRILIDLMLFNDITAFRTVNEMDLLSILKLAHTHNLLDTKIDRIPKDKTERFEFLFSLNEKLGEIIYYLPDEKFISNK